MFLGLNVVGIWLLVDNRSVGSALCLLSLVVVVLVHRRTKLQG